MEIKIHVYPISPSSLRVDELVKGHGRIPDFKQSCCRNIELNHGRDAKLGTQGDVSLLFRLLDYFKENKHCMTVSLEMLRILV